MDLSASYRAEIQALSLPPKDPSQVAEWTHRHGIADCLSDPISNLEPWLIHSPHAHLIGAVPEATMIQCIRGELPLGRQWTEPSRSEVLDAALAYLHYRACKLVLESKRQHMWSAVVDSKRLNALKAKITESLKLMKASPAAQQAVVYARAPWTIRTDPPELKVEFIPQSKFAWGTPVETRMSLVVVDVPLKLACNCSRGDGLACAHRRALAEWTLDAIHDLRHPMHARLKDTLLKPAWRQMIDFLQPEQDENGQDISSSQEQLIWRINPGQDFLIKPALRKQLQNGQWSRGRSIELNQLMKSMHQIEDHDRQILSVLFLGQHQNHFDSSDDQYAAALELLAGHPRVFLHNRFDRPIQVRHVRPAIRLSRKENQVGLQLLLGRHVVSALELASLRPGAQHLTWLDEQGGECLVARLGPLGMKMVKALGLYPSELPLESFPHLLRVFNKAQCEMEVKVPTSLRGELVKAPTECRLRLEPILSGGLEASLWVYPISDEPGWLPGEGPRHLFATAGGKTICAVRDLWAEREHAAALISRLKLPDDALCGSYQWRIEDQATALDLVQTAHQLGRQLVVEWPQDMPAWEIASASLSDLRVRVSRFQNWFQIEGQLEVDGKVTSLLQLLEAVRSTRRYLRLSPSRFVQIEASLQERIEQIDELIHPDQEGRLAISEALADRLAEILPESEMLRADKDWEDLCNRIRAAKESSPEIPAELRTILRDYQQEGFRWLARLSGWDAGACLADDMGLGKTIQALSVLLLRGSKGPALTVTPTSVGHGWVEQAERFTPSLKMRMYRGPNRHALLDNLRSWDVLVTSYDILSQDHEQLAESSFATLVLDEAQAIKNPHTLRAKAARELKAGFRLALTGTPIENHLGELWSIFHVVNPGLLGSWNHFKERFALPIERDTNATARDQLTRLLRPFLLRRTKAQVAPELPPRTNVVFSIELHEAERQLYERARQSALGLLSMQEGASNQERMAIFAALTRLRQLACHPRLVDPGSLIESSKLTAALGLIQQFISQGQRALVFSQFTGHLALLREQLDARGITYLYLDGSTPASTRAELTRRWHHENPCLFLISLKAGGTGLNLTGADVVFHLDPWWNPAVEDQASDRTHRIGQTKPVTVIRLVTQDTIEEAVLALHAHKRELAQSLLDGADRAARLTTEELIDLIGFGKPGTSCN